MIILDGAICFLVSTKENSTGYGKENAASKSRISATPMGTSWPITAVSTTGTVLNLSAFQLFCRMIRLSLFDARLDLSPQP